MDISLSLYKSTLCARTPYTHIKWWVHFHGNTTLVDRWNPPINTFVSKFFKLFGVKTERRYTQRYSIQTQNTVTPTEVPAGLHTTPCVSKKKSFDLISSSAGNAWEHIRCGSVIPLTQQFQTTARPAGCTRCCHIMQGNHWRCCIIQRIKPRLYRQEDVFIRVLSHHFIALLFGCLWVRKDLQSHRLVRDVMDLFEPTIFMVNLSRFWKFKNVPE